MIADAQCQFFVRILGEQIYFTIDNHIKCKKSTLLLYIRNKTLFLLTYRCLCDVLINKHFYSQNRYESF